MKRLVTVLLTIAISFAAVFALGCAEPAVKSVNVNEWIELSELLEDGDGFQNVKFTGDGTPRIDGCKILFDKTGVYTLTHSDDSKTKIEVKDGVPPDIRVNTAGFKPLLNETHALPEITVVDGYDGIIGDYTVKVDGQTTTDIKFTEYGEKTLTVTASDGSGNKSEKSFTLECIPETDVAVRAGTTVKLGADFFYGLDETENYNYPSFTVKKVKGTETTVLSHIDSFTVESGCYYETEGVITPMSGGDPVKNYKLYYEENLSVITFDSLGNGNYSDTERDFYLAYEVFESNGRQLVTLPAYSRVSADGVNGRLAVSSADENIWSWRFALKGESRKGTLYFDVSFEKPESEWLLEIVKDTEILYYEHAGRYCVKTEESGGDISYRFGVNGPKLIDNAVYLDNIIFVPDK